MDEERSIADRLRSLQQLHDENLITAEELSERRKVLLDAIAEAPTPPTPPPPASKPRKAAKWTDEEKAAYVGANPKKSMSTGAKIGIAVVITFGILYLLGSLASSDTFDSFDTDITFATIADQLGGGSSSLAFNKTFKGTGEHNTEPFRLSGDYTVTLATTKDCYYAFDIDRTSDGRTQENLGSHDGADSSSTRIYAVPSGSYFVQVITGPSPSCPWTVTIRN